MSDLISRKDAIALVDRPIVPTGDVVYDNARVDERASIKDDLLSLPSAEQKTKCIAQIKIDRDDIENMVNEMTKPKTGEWIEVENGEYLCSNCSHITIGYPPSYCPNCGSYNGGDEE